MEPILFCSSLSSDVLPYIKDSFGLFVQLVCRMARKSAMRLSRRIYMVTNVLVLLKYRQLP